MNEVLVRFWVYRFDLKYLAFCYKGLIIFVVVVVVVLSFNDPVNNFVWQNGIHQSYGGINVSCSITKHQA